MSSRVLPHRVELTEAVAHGLITNCNCIVRLYSELVQSQSGHTCTPQHIVSLAYNYPHPGVVRVLHEPLKVDFFVRIGATFQEEAQECQKQKQRKGEGGWWKG